MAGYDPFGFWGPSRTWKEWSGRDDGSDDYCPGDFRRYLKGTLFGSRSISSPNVLPSNYKTLSKGLESLQQGYKLVLESNTAHVEGALEGLSEALQELETRVEEVKTWHRKCEGHGDLLQVQTCSAARGIEDLPDWSMGSLYISTNSVFFMSNETPSWHIGPVRCENFKLNPTSVESTEACRDFWLHDKSKEKIYSLSGVGDCSVLQKLGFVDSAIASSSDHDVFHSFVDEETSVQLDAWMTEWGQPVEQQSLKSFVGPEPANSSGTPKSQLGKPLQVPGSSVKSFSTSFSASPEAKTFIAAAEELPDAEVPTAEKPAFSMKLEKCTIDLVSKVLSANENWIIQETTYSEATDVRLTPWTSSRRFRGTKMRRLRCKMPIPPAPACPPVSELTLLARLGKTPDRVVLVQEVCTHEVPFGESFFCQDVLVFRTSEDGRGVVSERFANVRWVSALPMMARWMKPIIHKTVRTESAKAGAKLGEYLEKLAESKLSTVNENL